MGCHSSEPAPIKDDSNGKSKQNQEKIESNICQIQKKEIDIEQEEQGRIEICSIPIMTLRNINCDMIKIPSNKTKGMRAVVITDTHLGKFKYAKPSIPILFDELKKLLKIIILIALFGLVIQSTSKQKIVILLLKTF